MRDIVCPICGGSRSSLAYASSLPADFDEAAPPPPYSAHYQINKCVTCSLLRSSPIMDDAGVAALYKESKETNVVPGEEPNVRATMTHYYDLAAPHLSARRRMLDIGCDMGFLLEAARRDGFHEMHGIEPNETARRTAASIPGVTVVGSFYEDTNYADGTFDLITLVHVLDHLVDPRIVLARVHGHLTAGGVVVAVVHNVDSLLGKLLGERFPIFNLYHHFFFNKTTLAELFRRQGYEVLDVVSTRNRYSLGFFARRLPGAPVWLVNAIYRVLAGLGVARIPITIPVGNIAVVARRLHV